MTTESNDSCGENNSSSANRSNATPIASLLKNGIDVEIRLKKELIELGILDISDFPKEKDDEVLNEIKRVRTELESIAEYNLNELKELRIAAKEEMKRLEIKRKLDAVDQEVCAMQCSIRILANQFSFHFSSLKRTKEWLRPNKSVVRSLNKKKMKFIV